MTTTVPPAPAAGVGVAQPVRRRFGLPAGAALLFLASIIVSFLAASSAPTPLYDVYASSWGFSALTTTIVFGGYALAVLAALLVFGRVSDHLGRRPVLLAALAGQAVAMLIFATAGGVAALLTARIVQGLSAGAALGAVGAGMVDIDRARGATANAVAPAAGTATGALASALTVQYLPAPTQLVYYLLLALFVLQAGGVVLLAETARPTPGALASLVPHLALPRRLRRPVAIVTPALLAVWAFAGFHGSLGPALTKSLVRSTSAGYGGLSLFLFMAVAAASVFLLRAVPARTVLHVSLLALIAAVGVSLVSIGTGAVAGFLLGSAVAGVGFGGGLNGSVRLVVPLAGPHERAGILSLLYAVSYLGMGVPVVVGGLLVEHGGGLLATSLGYGIAVIVLAAAALAGLVAAPARPAPARCGVAPGATHRSRSMSG
ncbi:MFS transporter [Micromonospora sp. WMMA1363]|uniref:MFS transporter n=1 Tax=Micromonospora sp. WMMA1363 TaxID=3053985 RepID=UPI00338F05FF